MTVTQTPTHAVFTAMQFHLERHMYKRGQFKGEAPLDGSRRGRTHERVAFDGMRDVMYVQFHRTRIFSVTRNGILTIHTNGYYDSPTTRTALRDCTKFLRDPSVPLMFGIGSEVVGSVRNTAIYVTFNGQTKAYPYRDGVQIDIDTGAVTYPGGETPTFRGRRKLKNQTAALRADMKESGFDAMFPLLYDTAVSAMKDAASVGEQRYRYHNGIDRIVGWSRGSTVNYVVDALSNPDGAGVWLEIVSAAIYPSGGYSVERVLTLGVDGGYLRTKAQTRSAIMTFATSRMYEMYDTGITCK